MLPRASAGGGAAGVAVPGERTPMKGLGMAAGQTEVDRPEPDLLRPCVPVFIGLGANLGDAPARLQWALERIGQWPQVKLTGCSSLYRSKPIDCAPGDPDFFNAVVALQTRWTSMALLEALQCLELEAGRERPYRNAPRSLDLDLLLYGQAQMDSPRLVVPHPRMGARAFVLMPLAEIAPERVPPQALAAVSHQAIERCTGWPQDLILPRPQTPSAAGRL